MVTLKHIHRASFYWLLAYWLIAVLIILLSVAFRILFELETAKQAGVRLVNSPAFVKALPYHWLLNLLVWYFFCRQYLKKIRSETPDLLRSETWNLALYWTLVSMLVDVIFWIVLPTPLRLTSAEIFGLHGRWISLTYPAIYLGTYLGGVFFIRHYKEPSEQK